ncbi:flavodoxin [Carnimonas bestiolae]|uniref:flavodoxin n=1 Tax=Carnimonas bestiolae TaxID=3402172 RepID=UPI003EDC54C4
MKILLAYDSLSGNTREVATLIQHEAEGAGHVVTPVFVTIESLQDVVPEPFEESAFDLYMLGSWSHNYGRTPPEMKEFIAELYQQVGKPRHTAVFGTGETQWGPEYYCGAVVRMANFFATPYPPLKIEQMPHGQRDRDAIIEWTHRVLAARSAASNEHCRDHIS